MEIVRTLLAGGPISTAELLSRLHASQALRMRGAALAAMKPAPLLEKIRVEMISIGWLSSDRPDWSPGEALRADVDGAALLGRPGPFMRSLCLAHERENRRVVSRLLARMWQLSPGTRGGLITLPAALPAPPAPDEDPRTWAASGWQTAARFLPDAIDADPPFLQDESLQRAINRWQDEKVGSHRPGAQLALQMALRRLVMARLYAMAFGFIIAPAEVDTWRRRLDWAGLTFSASGVASAHDRVWFPAGAFRRDEMPDFTPVPGLLHEGMPYCCHAPSGDEGEARFVSVLFRCYAQIRDRQEQEYVSLAAVRDQACYRLRIGNPVFETLLQRIMIRTLTQDIPYRLALEVDILPGERRRISESLPIVIDHVPRYIIAMNRVLS